MRHPGIGRVAALFVSLAVVAAACSSDDSDDTGDSAAATAATETEAPPDTTAPLETEAPTETEAPLETEAPPEALDVRTIVELLASDEMNGRDNQTPGSALARDLLVSELAAIAQPAYPDSPDGYLQTYDVGTNIIGVIPGGELADEYVVIGAHYDHHGNDCRGVGPDDDICNGAGDNAAGVGLVMDVARSIVAEGAPRRSVIVAFWDGEEDGLIGATAYLADPLVPLDQTVAYLNWDIQGVNPMPSLKNMTVLVGAETGGPALAEAAALATEASTLDTVMLSLLFGQGRSDHAVFAGSGVPVVFFTDGTSGCYHTVNDDVDVLDFSKLDQQILTATALTTDIIATDDVPVFDADASTSTYADASAMLRIAEAAESDFDLFDDETRATIEQFLVDLEAIVEAGPDAFDETANAIMLGGSVQLVASIADLPCDAYTS
ncbi:MAG: M28 family peptidase [Acidimicrobiia bacterium]|nr:M28 family peptidase [Acidimicrobiia bacterium]